MISRIHADKDKRTTGVTYFDAEGHERFQKAKAVVVAGRLLLNSACPGFENGLANSSDCVGRYLMAQAGNVVLGRFEELVRMYKAFPAHALTEEFYETDLKRGFARGFAIQTVGPLPVSFAKQMMTAKGAWGWGLRSVMMDYNHWAGFGVLGEILPHADNRVQIAEEKDHLGIPIAKITLNLYDNDKKLIAYGKDKTMEVMWAAGALRSSAGGPVRASCRRGAHGRQPRNFGCRPVRAYARYYEPVHLRWQHYANAGLGKPGTYDYGSGRARPIVSSARATKFSNRQSEISKNRLCGATCLRRIRGVMAYPEFESR